MRRITHWMRTWWLTVPEPRLFSLGWGVVYLMILATGIAAIYDPPLLILGEVGSYATRASIGWLNIVGALIAMASGYRDFWKGERLGLALMGSALAIFITVLASVHGKVDGSTIVPVGYCLALLTVIGLRFLMIRHFSFRPRG